VVCPQCGEQTLALFYPKHKSTSKPPRKNAYKCCADCRVAKHKVVTTAGVDVIEYLREIRNGMH
jgi:hypothetical protein